MKTLFLIITIAFINQACGVKKSPMPLYSYPAKAETDATPTPTPEGGKS